MGIIRPMSKGNGSRGNPPQPRNKFIWNGNCWCCNEPGHKRDTCEMLKKIMAANNGKKPEGYMGAYEKARKAWQGAKKKEREDRRDKSHLKPMLKEESDDDGANTEDEGSSEDDTLFCTMRVKPIHESKPTSTANHFAALTSIENDDGGCPHEGIATNFSSWAHKVVVNKKSLRSPQMSQKDRRMCERLANTDFENALVEIAGCTKPKLPTHGIEVKTEK